jgi:hypothetical protein
MVLSRAFSFDFVFSHITFGSGFLKIVKMRNSCAWFSKIIKISKLYIYIL